MADPTSSTPRRRADAERNREKILDAARSAFAEGGSGVSMAEISRRAEVGMATLYRNFPGRRELLEALYTGEVDAMCADAAALDGATPGAVFSAWLRRFTAFTANKHELASELLTVTDSGNPVFDGSRSRVMASGRPLLAAAQESGEVRAELTLEQVLDLVIAVGRIRGDADYVEPILRAALDGIRPPAG